VDVIAPVSMGQKSKSMSHEIAVLCAGKCFSVTLMASQEDHQDLLILSCHSPGLADVNLNCSVGSNTNEVWLGGFPVTLLNILYAKKFVFVQQSNYFKINYFLSIVLITFPKYSEYLLYRLGTNQLLHLGGMKQQG
jgi:hypothetical protein